MGLDPSQLNEFWRFFRISRMEHCSGNVGAWEIGQTLEGGGDGSGVNATDLELNPDRNMLMAVVRWVEEGVVPERLLHQQNPSDTPRPLLAHNA
ncbi:hypothetical protein D9758_016098 [Tetrapyrgos nigripes]|uniref:feruloyl esterase n=1 Tax=Tetrapyrgos nigripes TaxID=182062 RepID=A0A8H5FMR1_9AGAR|nr:hypothetical protein D9758_016098 [Tetrapyrgos nigripes]